jgi:hypothetical protein
MELAGSGVSSATVVEASPAYFEVARGEVESRYGSRPTEFVVGDFPAMAPTLPDADVVTLDPVVCCYPNAEDLLRSAAQRARRLVAFSYPRNRWYVRGFIAFENFLAAFKRQPVSGISSPAGPHARSVGSRRLGARHHATRNSGVVGRPLPPRNGRRPALIPAAS